MFDFVGSYLSYLKRGLIVNRKKFEPGIEQQNCQIS